VVVLAEVLAEMEVMEVLVVEAHKELLVGQEFRGKATPEERVLVLQIMAVAVAAALVLLE
jgi:hypothetical protein